jgi:hypothetical protein
LFKNHRWLVTEHGSTAILPAASQPYHIEAERLLLGREAGLYLWPMQVGGWTSTPSKRLTDGRFSSLQSAMPREPMLSCWSRVSMPRVLCPTSAEVAREDYEAVPDDG